MYIFLHISEVVLCYYLLWYDVDWKADIFIEFQGVAKIFLMSQHMNCTSGVEIELLNDNFIVVRSSVCVMISPGYLIRLSPTMRRVRYGYSFWGS